MCVVIIELPLPFASTHFLLTVKLVKNGPLVVVNVSFGWRLIVLVIKISNCELVTLLYGSKRSGSTLTGRAGRSGWALDDTGGKRVAFQRRCEAALAFVTSVTLKPWSIQPIRFIIQIDKKASLL